MRRLAQFVRLLASRVSRLSASVHVKGSECVRLRLASASVSRLRLASASVCICVRLASRVSRLSVCVCVHLSRVRLASVCVCSRQGFRMRASASVHVKGSECVRLRLVRRSSCASVVLSRVCLASVVLSRVGRLVSRLSRVCASGVGRLVSRLSVLVNACGNWLIFMSVVIQRV